MNSAMFHLQRNVWRLKSIWVVQAGGILLETVILLSIFGVLGVSVAGAMQTSYMAERRFNHQSTAENLIRNQFEYVFLQPYQVPSGAYSSIPTPPDYLINVESLAYPEDPANPDVSVVRITVSYHGEPLRVMETVRARRWRLSP
jgi:type II secretory pathway pseudopilin PulG